MEVITEMEYIQWHKPAGCENHEPRSEEGGGGGGVKWSMRSSECVNEVTVSCSAKVAAGGKHLSRTGVYLSRLGPLFIH